MRFVVLLLISGLGAAFGFYWLLSQLPEGAPRTEAPMQRSTGGEWIAVAGDRVQLDEIVLRLHGVTCPAPETDAGGAAKAALAEMLGAGAVDCQVLDTQTARCRVADRDLSQAIKAGGLCD